MCARSLSPPGLPAVHRSTGSPAGVGNVGVLETERLSLRELRLEDAGFIVELLNDASFLRFVGDKGVRTLEDARHYLQTGPIDSYGRLGFGLWLVELKRSGAPVGICGLLKRDTLDDVDIGFAFLPRYRSKGYAFESASAVLDFARNVLKLKRIVAITDEANVGSIRVLEKIGMSFDRMIRLADDGPEIKLLSSDA
jgi:[ribosomal protein S5]-alanine N-acetyltransferase